MAAPLQLTDVAHGEQRGWRRSQHLVDSLPYVDGLTPQEKAAVDKLIEEEVRRRAQLPLGCAAAACPPLAATPRDSLLGWLGRLPGARAIPIVLSCRCAAAARSRQTT